ncbi:hypothetical protein C8Q70DRAFT_621142 [Cubamyces menziesii]|nr:hypothetical protein C8Q70DRAFT_621142 [Cubamyces menziesii]
MICANDDARLTCRRRRSSAAPNGAITQDPRAKRIRSRSPLEARPWTPASSGTVPSHLEAETPGSLRSRCPSASGRAARGGRAFARPRGSRARWFSWRVVRLLSYSTLLMGRVWVRTEGGGRERAASEWYRDAAPRGTPADARLVPDFGVVYGADMLVAERATIASAVLRMVLCFCGGYQNITKCMMMGVALSMACRVKLMRSNVFLNVPPSTRASRTADVGCRVLKMCPMAASNDGRR